MTRAQVLTVLSAVVLLAVFGWRAREAPFSTDAPDDLRAAIVRSEAADPRVDSARSEAAAGRHWHAATLLREAARAGVALEPEEVLLLARSDFGWRNWSGIVERLEGKPWLDGTGGGEGWLLLARAREARAEWSATAAAFTRYLATPHAEANPLALAVMARQARALGSAGRGQEALTVLGRASAAPFLVSWAALDAASVPADSGRVTEVRALLERVSDDGARTQGWELLPRALLAAGDSAGAEAAYRSAAASISGDARRARAWAMAGDLTRARGDEQGARAAYQDALKAGLATPGGARAAKALLAMGRLDAEQALLVARSLDRTNDDATTLQAYDLHVRLRGGVEQVGESVRLDLARILAVTGGRADDAVAELGALSASGAERVGAHALELWAQLRQRQGRTADVATLRERLIQRFPSSTEAADVVFFRGDAPHDRNDLDAALAAYRRLIAMAPAQDRAGLATMRAGQILLLRKDAARAAEVYEGYLASFPTGRRWQEASYWAGRIRLSLGDTARARALIDRLRREDPFSYYAVIAAPLVGEEFRLDLPPGAATPIPAWIAQGVERLDLLLGAGLAGGASAEVERLTARARGEPAAILSLAEALIARDRTIEAINLGFELRRQGSPWTVRLARVVYPWRYQEVFWREAAEDGMDVFLVAALARQESAFDPDIRSSANAIGLMQLLPATAAQLARSAGPQGFREELLEVPDINVHLGTLYLRDQLREYRGDLTRMLAAYNAGPHRVVRWREFAEAGDPLTFTERIPFAETRDYVKQVQRNLAIYRQLYGDARPPSL